MIDGCAARAHTNKICLTTAYHKQEKHTMVGIPGGIRIPEVSCGGWYGRVPEVGEGATPLGFRLPFLIRAHR